jgi:hypothetical protein
MVSSDGPVQPRRGRTALASRTVPELTGLNSLKRQRPIFQGVDRYECQPEQDIHKHIVVIANSLIPAMSRWVHCRAAGLLPMTKLRVAGPENSSSAGYRPPAFTDRGRFCRRVFLLLLPGAVSC